MALLVMLRLGWQIARVLCARAVHMLLQLAVGVDLQATFQQLLPLHYIWENAEPLQD